MLESIQFFKWMIKAIIDANINEAKILAEHYVLNLIHKDS